MSQVKLTDYKGKKILGVISRRCVSPWHLFAFSFYLFGYCFLPSYFFIELLVVAGILQIILYEFYKGFVSYYGVLKIRNQQAVLSIPFFGDITIRQPSLLYVRSERTYYLIFKSRLFFTVTQPLLFQEHVHLQTLIQAIRDGVSFEREISSKWLINFHKGNYKKLEDSDI